MKFVDDDNDPRLHALFYYLHSPWLTHVVEPFGTLYLEAGRHLTVQLVSNDSWK